MKFVSKEAQNLNIVATILNSTQQPGCVYVTSVCLKDVVHMASNKPFTVAITLGNGCSWAILFVAKHAPNSEVITWKV